MREVASFLPIIGVILAVIILTVIEILGMKFSKRVDSPKFIWYPISANIVGLVIIFVVILIAIALFAVGFIVAFGEGFDAGEKYFYLMGFALVLIPVLFFAVRTILFLLFKLGKLPIALLYSCITTIINLVVIIVTGFVFLGIYENVFK